MGDKAYKGAPFGTQMARFDVSGVHPKLKPPGTFTQGPYDKITKASNYKIRVSSNLGPGSYDPIDKYGFSPEALEKKTGGPGWARQKEVERQASMPTLLFRDEWFRRKEEKRKLGPGTYDIVEADERKRYVSKSGSTRGMLDLKEGRFRPRYEPMDTPGPGVYGENGNPHHLVEEKMKKSASTKGIMDAGSHRAGLPLVGCDIAPCAYDIKGSTGQLTNKVVSSRGPYDLFSLDRNKPIKTGHYAIFVTQNLGPGQYESKSFVDNLTSQENKQHGKFGKGAQYEHKPSSRIGNTTMSQIPRASSEPGPGYYPIHEVNYYTSSSHNTSPPSFLSSAPRNDRMSTRFFTGNHNSVGPGRYDIQKTEDNQNKNGHESDFKSKTQRPSPNRMKFLQERLRSKDVPAKDRVHIIPPEKSPYRERTGGFKMTSQSDIHTQFINQRSITVA